MYQGRPEQCTLKLYEGEEKIIHLYVLSTPKRVGSYSCTKCYELASISGQRKCTCPATEQIQVSTSPSSPKMWNCSPQEAANVYRDSPKQVPKNNSTTTIQCYQTQRNILTAVFNYRFLDIVRRWGAGISVCLS